jgi:hypothetical protein
MLALSGKWAVQIQEPRTCFPGQMFLFRTNHSISGLWPLSIVMVIYPRRRAQNSISAEIGWKSDLAATFLVLLTAYPQDRVHCH